MGKKFGNSKLPVTENIYNRVVRLPLFPDMTRREMDKIIKNIREFIL